MPKQFRFKKPLKRKIAPMTEVAVGNSLQRQFARKGIDPNQLPAFINQDERTKWMREFEELEIKKI
jgi:hypothetical protein